MHLLILHHSAGKKKVYEGGLQDIEFYSSTPFEDLVSLANKLAPKYKNIQVKEAAHPMTYTLYVNYQAFCDASYMPANIYETVEFYEIQHGDNNLKIINASFIFIDKLRMFSDPVLSYRRIEKELKRMQLFAQYLEIKHIKKIVPT
jgi:hypothetical protein